MAEIGQHDSEAVQDGQPDDGKLGGSLVLKGHSGHGIAPCGAHGKRIGGLAASIKK